MDVVFADTARWDIAEIYDTIALNNPAAALRVEALIREKCGRLAEFPYSGYKTNRTNVIRLPLVRYPYVIYYRVDVDLDRVVIARVIHAARIKNLRRAPPIP